MSNLFGESSGDSLESMVFLSTLTRTQKAAVEKRVETVTQTMRKKNKQHQIPDVRDIFRLQNDSKGNVSSCRLFCLILAEERGGEQDVKETHHNNHPKSYHKPTFTFDWLPLTYWCFCLFVYLLVY